MGLTTLKTSADFEKVFAERKRFFKNGVGFYLRTVGTGEFRFGMVTPRRFGKAVDRNTFKRRVREILRKSRRIPSGVEVVICVYKPFDQIGFDLLNQTLGWAIERMRRQVLPGISACSRNAGQSS